MMLNELGRLSGLVTVAEASIQSDLANLQDTLDLFGNFPNSKRSTFGAAVGPRLTGIVYKLLYFFWRCEGGGFFCFESEYLFTYLSKLRKTFCGKMNHAM